MTDISLTTGGYTFTFAEGEVNKIRSNIDSGIESQKISATGPGSSYVYDYEGCEKIITISGQLIETSTTRVTGYSINTIIEQKQWLESLANGAQGIIELTSNYEEQSVLYSASATAPYLGSFTSTYCKVKSLNFEETMGEVNKVDFELVLYVGS
jgi:hypothetical protein